MATITESVGRVLAGRYRIEAGIGTGASAHVYLATDVSLRRRVAIKMLHPALASDRAFLRRFRGEAQAAASLTHPGLVAVYDWGESEDGPFLVLEFLGGGSLRHVLDAGTHLDTPQIARVGMQAAQGLAYAHTRGFVHRDVKPANLLFDADGHRVCVADFGLARALAEAAWTEPVGATLGTARYAAPEQAQGKRVDGRADVYALGLVLYECVTGEVPFSADTTIATLMARIGAKLPSHDKLGLLEDVLVAATAPEPGDRLDAAELGDWLGELAMTLPPPDRLVPYSGPGPAVAMATRVGSGIDVDPTEHAARWSPAAAAPGRNGLVDDKDELLDVASAVGVIDERWSAGQIAASPPGDRRSPPVGVPDDVLPQWSAPESAPTTTMPSPGAPWNAAPQQGTTPSPAASPATATAATNGSTGRDGDGDSDGGGGATKRRHRRWPWIVLAALVVGAGAGVAGYKAEKDKKTVVVPSHRVPALTGDDVAGANQALQKDHFKVRVTGSAASMTAKPGTIVGQIPSAGVSMKQGGTIGVTLSSGPPTVSVPFLADVAGGCPALTQTLQQSLLKTSCSVIHSTTVAAGKVISWSPQGHTLEASVITVTVSDGPPTVAVPDLSGTDLANAESILQSNHLLESTLAPRSSFTVPAGQVASWTDKGATVPWGTTIGISISTGPPMVDIQTVVGDTLANAEQALQSQGLVVPANDIFGPGGPNSIVIFQSPVGQSVEVGSSVELWVR